MPSRKMKHTAKSRKTFSGQWWWANFYSCSIKENGRTEYVKDLFSASTPAVLELTRYDVHSSLVCHGILINMYNLFLLKFRMCITRVLSGR